MAAPIRIFCLFMIFAIPGWLHAQGTATSFGLQNHDSSLPVEVTSETLKLNQADNTAVFTGDVVIAQGDLRLSAPNVRVVYLADRSGIERLEASGGVTLVSGEDAAEAREAAYDLTTGKIEMQGDVLLNQGPNSLTGDRMLVDVNAGSAQMQGRVKTILQPGTSE